MTRTRRQWLLGAAVWPGTLALLAARKEFWESKDPVAWSSEEKQILLSQSPWARAGFARMEVEKNRRPARGYWNEQKPGAGVPIGEKPPPVPNPDPGEPVQFPVLARWETASPVRLAGAPELPQLTGHFYIIRLRGLPLMPPPKVKPGEPATDPNLGMLQAIKEGSRLERKEKPAIPCTHLFAGSRDVAGEVLLFFPSVENPITLADKWVTLESRFVPFYLSVRFLLKDMVYKGELAL